MTYHKLVNTTPNPSATKNSSGLLVGLALPWSSLSAGVGMFVAEVVVAEDIVYFQNDIHLSHNGSMGRLLAILRKEVGPRSINAAVLITGV